MEALFWATWAAMVILAALHLVLHALSIGSHDPEPPRRDLPAHPFVTIQVPVFDDATAAGCVQRLLALDYPKDRYEILLCDDSRDPKVIAAMQALVRDEAPRVLHLHRTHREGFKPGALAAALPHSRGELIAIFDADWRPGSDFLAVTVPHFADPQVAIVQARETYFANADQSWVSRYASTLLWAHHAVTMRAARRVGAVFFCGTGGVLRRSALEAVGGWNTRSITEDAELSVRLLGAGYTSVYLDHEVVSDVPWRLGDFLRQQARWCFGNVEIVVRDPRVLSLPTLPLGARFVVAAWLLAHLSSIAGLVYVTASALTWIAAGLGAPAIHFPWWAWLLPLAGHGLAFTRGLAVHGRLSWFPLIALLSMTLGVVLCARCTYEVGRVLAGRPGQWVRTPKSPTSTAEGTLA